MKNSDIKYKTSTDYERLYSLLKHGNVIIGFVAIYFDGVPSDTHSKLINISYNDKYKTFDFGFTFFESDFDKISFVELCENEKVRYIDLL